MLLVSLILGIVLLPKVTSLKCLECMGSDSCTTTERTCPSGQTNCGAMSVLSYAAGAKINGLQIKSCTAPAECIGGSLNFGISSTYITSQCCNSDLCNYDDVPATKSNAPNGLQCYTCNGQTCDGTLDCMGDEDHCISTQFAMGETTMNFKGCASSAFCSKAANAQLKMAVGEAFTCCQGNHCNGRKTARSAESGGQRSSTCTGLLLPMLLLPLVMSS